MKIENIKISEIKSYSKNAKKHDAKQIDAVAKSIKRFGWASPVAIDKNNELIIGHCRILAAQKLGIAEVPTLRMEGLSEEEVKALRLADNKLNESDWDMGLAIEELKGLSDEMFDLTGFDKDLLIEPDDQDDVIPEVKESKSKLGDLYELGKHRVLCGDSTKREDVERLMDGRKADMVFTDPPYNIGFSYNQHNDKMKYDDYAKFCKNFFELLDCERVIITPGPRNLSIWYDILDVKDVGWYREEIVDEYVLDIGMWYKKNSRSGASCFHFRQCEPIVFYGKFDRKRNFDFFDFKRVIKKELTEAQKGKVNKKDVAPGKPVLFVSDVIKSFSDEQNLVKDVFLGNGTTLIAAEKTNRVCYGMELDPKYTDIIVERYCAYTGNRKIKKNGIEIEWE